MKPATEWNFSASVREAKTAVELERIWIRNYRDLHLYITTLPSDLDRNGVSRPRARARRKREIRARKKALMAAVEQRGWELVQSSPVGWKIPRLRFRGAQCVATIREESYKTGHWGNGPGYRYAMHYLREWVKKAGRYRKQAVADSVVDWVLFGMPHRALRRIGKVI